VAQPKRRQTATVGSTGVIQRVVAILYNGGVLPHYNGPLAAPQLAGMVGSIVYDVFDQQGGTLLYQTGYCNGAVKNHIVLGCC
jgi:hypothetical protein